MINFCHNLGLFSVKNAYFSPIVWQKYLKIITSVPGREIEYRLGVSGYKIIKS
jgi:hypothetical protein